jgi:hypothetical protein
MEGEAKQKRRAPSKAEVAVALFVTDSWLFFNFQTNRIWAFFASKVHF